MVRVTLNSKISNRVAGCAPSQHNPSPPFSSPVPCVTRGPMARSAVDREKARADARQSKKGAEVKAKLRSCISRNGTISIPAADLLVCHSASLYLSVFLTACVQNELPVRVREEVEAIRNCCLPCLPASHRPGYATARFLAANLHKHQLFSKEHADNLDPEIRQWLPRLVCPAFPLSPKCRGQCVVVEIEFLKGPLIIVTPTGVSAVTLCCATWKSASLFKLSFRTSTESYFLALRTQSRRRTMSTSFSR